MKKLVNLNNVDFVSKAFLKNILISPRKANEVLRGIRKRYVQDAQRILFCTKRKSASLVKNLLSSAISNAGKSLSDEQKSSLVVMRATVGRGPIMNRMIFCGRGKRGVESKRMANFEIQLGLISSDMKSKKESTKKDIKIGVSKADKGGK